MAYLQSKVWIFCACFVGIICLKEIKQVEFYDGSDFQGLIWQGPASAKVVYLPISGQRVASSVITNTCVMIYSRMSNDRYDDFSPRFVLLPGHYPDLSKISHATQNANDSIVGFRECEEDEGDKSVHVELIFVKRSDSTETLTEYFNLRRCANLPLYSFTKVNRVNNHGNCIKLFNSTDCVGDFVTIHGGRSAESLDLKTINFDGKTKSISPCNILA